MITMRSLDHLVLTVADLETTLDFYVRALGMRVVHAERGPTALHFANHKINVHEAGHEFEPKSARPTPGSGDFCLITEEEIDAVMAHLSGLGIEIEVGPVTRLGALGPMTSVYFRDPDQNLVEVARYHPNGEEP